MSTYSTKCPSPICGVKLTIEVQEVSVLQEEIRVLKADLSDIEALASGRDAYGCWSPEGRAAQSAVARLWNKRRELTNELDKAKKQLASHPPSEAKTGEKT